MSSGVSSRMLINIHSLFFKTVSQKESPKIFTPGFFCAINYVIENQKTHSASPLRRFLTGLICGISGLPSPFESLPQLLGYTYNSVNKGWIKVIG
jgi:hypothetical protein